MWQGHTESSKRSREGFACPSSSAVSASSPLVCAAREASSASSSYGRLASLVCSLVSKSLPWLHANEKPDFLLCHLIYWCVYDMVKCW